ncbi:MAG TPA: nuclear transport factor 2 family protein, partial [Ideonella sp.]|nr:nuclear transport factor 2 family protein [Ideonella sp.]
MRSLLPLLFAGLLLASARAEAGTADELNTLEEQRRDAIAQHDFARLASIYAPEFVAVAGNGQLIDREQLFRIFGQGDPTLRFTTDQVRIVEQGGTAVFIGRLVARTPAGTLAFASRFSHVFVRRGDAWVCIAGQS